MPRNKYLPEGNPYMGGEPEPRPTPRGRQRVQEGWEIEETRAGQFDLRYQRRPVFYDRDSIEEAVREIRRRDPDARTVTIIDPDGYRHAEPLIALA